MIAALTLADRADVLRAEEPARTGAARGTRRSLPPHRRTGSSGLTTLQALPVRIAPCCRDVESDDVAPAFREAH
jgi:hypothetical protein